MKFFPKNISRNSVFILVTAAAASGCMGGGGGGGGGTAPSGSASAGTSSDVVSGTTTGSAARLTWDVPKQNVDGSQLRDLVGYKLSYGLSPGAYSEAVTLDLDDVSCQFSQDAVERCSYTVRGLDSASWYFALQASDSDGNLSALSEPAVVTVQ